MAGFPEIRPRRLRRTPALRRLVAETVVSPSQLVLPLFVAEDATEPREISTMPGVVQHTRDSLKKAATDAVEAGLGGVMLFGLPAEKDAIGSGAIDPHGILNVAISDVDLRGGRPAHGDGRPVPRRVHRPRPLRRARPRRLGRQRPHHRDLRPDGGGPGRGRRRPRRPQRDDGRPGRHDPQGARRRGARRRRHHGLLREVLLRLLRSLPRGRELLAQGRPQDLPAGPRQRPRGRPRGPARRGRGRRHRDGEAGDVLPRRRLGRPGGGRRARSRRTTSPASTPWSRPPPPTAGSTATPRSSRCSPRSVVPAPTSC